MKRISSKIILAMVSCSLVVTLLFSIIGKIENEAFKFITEGMDKQESGVEEYAYKGQRKMLGFSDLSSGHNIVVTVPEEEVIEAMEGISAVTQETSASTEEILASMEQQSSVIEEVSKGAGELQALALKLKELLSKFKF